MDVRKFLDGHGVPYEALPHRPAYDAQRLAQAVDETGYHVAKTVLLKGDSDHLLAVLPATHRVDLADVTQRLRVDRLELASEEEVVERFPDCETGAVPPFGSRYGMTTLVDEALSEQEEIVFEGNTHEEAIRMRFADYFELEKPVVTRLSHPATT
jgi:Ala-tRNA(Pro) deacylase